MELQVKLTLSDRLFALLEDKLPNLGRRIEKAGTKEIGAQTRKESSISVAVSAKTPETAATAAEEVPEPQPEQAQPAAGPKLFAEAPVQQPEKDLTEEDIRAAMHRTRQRFEGEDYKENTDSEAYKKYHRQLKGVFMQIAAVLGADKPSKLPADKRAAFIAECDALIIGDDGNITSPQHPTK